MNVLDDGQVVVPVGAKNDVYVVDLPLDAGSFQGIRLDVLPDEALPGHGPGHAGGNFVLSRSHGPYRAAGRRSRCRGAMSRVELPGPARFLHLAEVQVFHGNDNLALAGVASQSSTAYDGPAALANDGNTNGRYAEAKSTSHTRPSDNPWWEVDLKRYNRSIAS